MPLFGRKKEKKPEKDPKAEKPQGKKSYTNSSLSPSHQHIAIYGADKKIHSSPPSSSSVNADHEGSSSPTPSSDIKKLISPSWGTTTSHGAAMARNTSGSGKKVAAQRQFYEAKIMSSRSEANRSSIHGPGSTSPRRVSSPEKKRRERDDTTVSANSSRSTSRINVSVTSPTSGSRTPDKPSRPPSEYMGSASPLTNKRFSSVFAESGGPSSVEIGKEKEFTGVNLPLPPLQTTAVRLREVDARRNAQGGGFGFILRKSYLPVPEEPDKTKLVHLIEPRSDYTGPLMTGDRIIEVNGEVVEDEPHEAVVELIKASGDCVNLRVASMPELVELNNRGALDSTFERNSGLRKSGKAKQGTGMCFLV